MPDAYFKNEFSYCKGGKTEPPPGSVNIAGSKTWLDESCTLRPDDKIRTLKFKGKLVPNCWVVKNAVDTAKNPAFETHQEVVAALNALTKAPTEVCDGPDDCRPVWDD
ncbi:hypothetical protein MAA_11759 [Metarhizium robertsii ARSEF 23]|uniref:Uncharacterized protein n=1 Tax=Metarhizium robertsii (strain ARSEF 23 / ATCC MYA-3075) TaxID=655844 RepID=A0A0B2XFF4_METRA|nr:uncharacterized protein MAA_11759 [Metarhizium robertsii ARSEF 23]KHO10641.1 hypothetical protein MAA_11759 [Metarhizium robertsii ARSEF 23]